MNEERNCYNCGFAAITEPIGMVDNICNIHQLEVRCTIQEGKAGFDFEDPLLRCLGKVIPPGQNGLPCRRWRPRP